MSRKKAKRYAMWVEPGKSHTRQSPEIYRLLPPLILELVLMQDATGPSCYQVVREEYVAQLAASLHEPVVRALQQARIGVSDDNLTEICRLSAGEAFVLRGLNEARITGEISIKDIRRVPFYRTYQDYFEQSPEIVARGVEIRTAVAKQAHRGTASQK
jgi:hypothetical protein